MKEPENSNIETFKNIKKLDNKKYSSMPMNSNEIL